MKKQEQAADNQQGTQFLHGEKGFFINKDSTQNKKQRGQLNYGLGGFGVDVVKTGGKQGIVATQTQRSDQQIPAHPDRCFTPAW